AAVRVFLWSETVGEACHGVIVPISARISPGDQPRRPVGDDEQRVGLALDAMGRRLRSPRLPGVDVPGVDASMSPRPQPRRAMRWADVYVGMLADGVALRNRCPQGQADPRAAIAGGASGVTMARAGAAGAAIRTKDSALGARYRRVMRHRGHKKAVVAVAHAMLRAVYHLLAEG